jgi:protein TonB
MSLPLSFILLALGAAAAQQPRVPGGMATHVVAPPPIVSVPTYPPPPVMVTLEPAPSRAIDAVGGLQPPIIVSISPAPGVPSIPIDQMPTTIAPPPPAALIRGPQPRQAPQALVTPADYPAAALAWQQEGRVGFVLTVGANGRATRCAVTESSGSSVLDSATCRLMVGRARFTPAVDSNGNPAVARIVQQVDWRLP